MENTKKSSYANADLKYFCNFASEPRDMRYLRGGIMPGIGRFVYIRKAFTALNSWF